MNKHNKRKLRLLLCLTLMLLFAALTAPSCFAEGEGLALNASGIPNRAPSVNPTGKTEGFSAVMYNNLNGLPTADANAIAETSEGFLWIGSYAGLIRYDGNTFERLDSTNGITSIRSLFVDSRDRLWIGTNANGFAVMERGEYRIWDLRDGLKSSSIRAFAEDSSGVIYAATTSGIAMVDTDMNMTMLADPSARQRLYPGHSAGRGRAGLWPDSARRPVHLAGWGAGNLARLR